MKQIELIQFTFTKQQVLNLNEILQVGIFEIERMAEGTPIDEKLTLLSRLFEREAEKIKIENWIEDPENIGACCEISLNSDDLPF